MKCIQVVLCDQIEKVHNLKLLIKILTFFSTENLTMFSQNETHLHQTVVCTFYFLSNEY